MSSTSLLWRYLVNACEVKASLIGSLANNSAPSVSGSLYSLGYTWLLLLACMTVCVCRVIAALRGRLLYVVYRM